MTIGLGFQCSGGVVLCADSQITKEGGLKYNDKKIFVFRSSNASGKEGHGIAMCYAGSAEIMKLICERVEKELWSSPPPDYWDPFHDGSTWNDMLRGRLADTFKDIYKTHGTKRNVELLCAIYSPKEGVSLYRAGHAVIRAADMAECIGVGDSSVLRFLSDLFVRQELTIKQCLVLGCYMVVKANTYIDGCGGPTQALFLTPKGKMRNLNDIFVDGLAPEDGLPNVERAMGNLMYGISRKDKPKAEIDVLLDEFKKSIADIHWPSVLEYKNPDYFEE